MTYIVTQDVVIVNSISDFPEPVGGVITLEAKRYKLNTIIVTSNRFVVPAAGTCSLDGVKDFGAGIVYTGAGIMFSGTLASGVAFAFRNGLIISAPSGTCFDIDGADTTPLFFVEECVFSDIDTLGTFDTIQMSLNHSTIQDCGDGLIGNDMNLVGIHGVQFLNWKNQVSADMIKLTGATTGFTVINSRFEIGSNEYAINITGTIGIGSISNVIPTAPTRFYNPVGKDQTYIQLSSLGIQGVPDSTITGRLKVIGNTDETTIGTAAKFEPINATFTDGIIEERIIFLSDYGELEYAGIETTQVKVNGWASLKNAIGVEQDLQIQIIQLINKTSCVFDDATDYITAVGHGLANDEAVELKETGGLPTNLSENVPYFIINKTDDTFQISLTSGGAAIDFGSDGTPTNHFMQLCCGSVSSITAASNIKTRAVSVTDLFNIETGNIIKLYVTNLDASNNVIVSDLNVNIIK